MRLPPRRRVLVSGVLPALVIAVYTHHEKWDGTGYPQGLRGTSIPIGGRLMALVDVYDAVTSCRVYREPMTHDERSRSSSPAGGRISIRRWSMRS